MYELQEFNGRQYQHVATHTDPKVLQGILWAEREPGEPLRRRRLVRLDKARPLRPVAPRRPDTYRGPRLGTLETVGAYMAWAKAAGLQSVTVYGDTRRRTDGWRCSEYARRLAAEGGLAVREVAVADILGDAPAAEIEP